MDKKTADYVSDMQKRLWAKRVTVPAHVFEALCSDFSDTLNAQIATALSENTNSLLAKLGGIEINASARWHTEPALDAYKNINRLSKGFKLAAQDMAVFFGNGYISAGVKDALFAPETPPAGYPTNLTFAAIHFLKAVSKYIPEEFWEQSEDLQTIDRHARFITDSYQLQQAGKSALVMLYEAQLLQRAMPLIATALEEKGLMNFATIATCFSKKGRAMSEDIIARVDASLKESQTISLEKPAP